MRDILTVAWKEWLEAADQFGLRGRSRAALWSLIGTLAILTPAIMGPAWADSPLMIGYWPVVASSVVVTLIADGFAGERERRTLETLLATRLGDRAILFGKLGAAVLWAVAVTLAVMALGTVTINLIYFHEGPVRIPASHVLASALVSFAAASAVGSAGIHISLRAQTVRQAHQHFGILLMASVLTPLAVLRILPESASESLARWMHAAGMLRLASGAVAGLLVIALAAIGLALVRFRRGRLSLE